MTKHTAGHLSQSLCWVTHYGQTKKKDVDEAVAEKQPQDGLCALQRELAVCICSIHLSGAGSLYCNC